MKKIIILLVLFLVIFFVYILSTKVKNNKLESFFADNNNCNCEDPNINKLVNNRVISSDDGDLGNKIDLSKMKYMCRNYGYEMVNRDYKKIEENMFYGDCKKTCLDDKDCYSFQFTEKDLSGYNGTCTYYTVGQSGGMKANNMKEAEQYNSSYGYNSVLLKSEEPCVTEKCGFMTTKSIANNGNNSSYNNKFQNDQNKYYNNIFENNLNMLMKKRENCFSSSDPIPICTTDRVFNFTLDEANPAYLYIYTVDSNSPIFKIQAVNNNSDTGCFIPNNFTPLTNNIEIKDFESFLKLPIKFQVFQDKIYYSSINQYINSLSIYSDKKNDIKTLNTSGVVDWRFFVNGQLRLFNNQIYFINNGSGNYANKNTSICYFTPGDPITINNYETQEPFKGDLIDFEILHYNYRNEPILIGLTDKGKLAKKMTSRSKWQVLSDSIILSSIHIDSRDNPNYLYGINRSGGNIIRKKITEIISDSNSGWENISNINESIFRFKIFNINEQQVIFYITNDFKRHLYCQLLNSN